MQRTPYYELHKELGAKFVPFAGWEMPVQFSSILEEAKEVRKGVGIFDVSHMGRLFIEGPDAERFLNFLTTNNVEKLKEGEVQYSLILNERGGTVDDITVYKFSKDRFMVVVNAANRQKVLEHFNNFKSDFDVSVSDRSGELTQLAVQGPKAVELLKKIYPGVENLRYYTFGEFGGTVISRTGYTGEDGFEVYIPAEGGIELYQKLLKMGAKPCGLGARDILRIEAGFPLYGHELGEDMDPREANLSKFIDLQKEFLGKEALLEREPKRKLRGLVLQQRRVTRQGDKVYKGETLIGEISSGTFSPNLGKAIALAFLDRDIKLNDSIEVEIRGKRVPAKVVKGRFISNVAKKTK